MSPATLADHLSALRAAHKAACAAFSDSQDATFAVLDFQASVLAALELLESTLAVLEIDAEDDDGNGGAQP